MVFDALRGHAKLDFWPHVKRILKCDSDWPLKHYANSFSQAKYTVKL